MNAPRHIVNPAFLARLERALMIAARAVEHDPAALPIFERIDRELEAASRAAALAKLDGGE